MARRRRRPACDLTTSSDNPLDTLTTDELFLELQRRTEDCVLIRVHFTNTQRRNLLVHGNPTTIIPLLEDALSLMQRKQGDPS